MITTTIAARLRRTPTRRPLAAAAAALALLAALTGAPSGSASAQTLDQIKRSGTINIVTTSQNPPHGFYDAKTQRPEGVMVELCDAVAKDLGVKTNYTEVPFGGLIGTIQGGRADLMCAPLFITAERAKVIDFSAPVYGWGEGLVVKDSNTKSYPDIKSLAGSSVGCLVSSTQYKLLQGVPGITNLRTYDNYIELLADLQAGRIDVGMIDPPSIRYIMKTNGISGLKLVSDYHPVTHNEIALVVQKGNAALLQFVDADLRKMKADGRLKAILNQWNLGEYMAP